MKDEPKAPGYTHVYKRSLDAVLKLRLRPLRYFAPILALFIQPEEAEDIKVLEIGDPLLERYMDLHGVKGREIWLQTLREACVKNGFANMDLAIRVFNPRLYTHMALSVVRDEPPGYTGELFAALKQYVKTEDLGLLPRTYWPSEVDAGPTLPLPFSEHKPYLQGLAALVCGQSQLLFKHFSVGTLRYAASAPDIVYNERYLRHSNGRDLAINVANRLILDSILTYEGT